MTAVCGDLGLCRLLVVAGEAGVGLVEGAIFDADAAVGHVVQLVGGLLEEVTGEVFGGRVELLVEGLEVVDHLVVEAVDDGAHDLLEEFEIKQEAGVIKIGANEGDEDFVVVAMRVLALALVVAEIVAGGEAGFHGDFKHCGSVAFPGTLERAGMKLYCTDVAEMCRPGEMELAWAGVKACGSAAGAMPKRC